jgi:hypothetical protein
MNIRPAQATLNEIRGGDMLNELASAIHDAVAAVQEHGKAAVVSLKITIDIPKNMKNLADPYLVVTGEVDVKLPKPDSAQTLFKIDDGGNLTQNLSRAQNDLPLSIAVQPKE